LQIEPRAAWTKIAAVLGVDAVTVARRWARLCEERLVWATAHELGTLDLRGAIIEVECARNPVEVAVDLAKDPECYALDITSGGRDLLMTPYAPDEFALTEYLLTRVSGRPDVRRARIHLITGHFGEGSAWRLRELTSEQVERFADSGSVVQTPRAALSTVERAVIAALREDARMSAIDIAERVGIPVRRARETVQHLLSSKRIRLRTEVARSVSGWPIQAWYFVRVPARRLLRVGAQLARLEELRLVVSAAGPHNLILVVWLGQLGDVTALEARIEDALEGVEISDRCIALRSFKRAGHLIDVQGRRIGQTSQGPVVRPVG
jgi:DNA-binding Lrp family transcriptional regulator